MTRPIRPTGGFQPLLQTVKQSTQDISAMQLVRSRPIPIKDAGPGPGTAPPPSDSDYTARTMPPVGTLVYYTVTHKLYVRDAPGSWLASPAFS